MCLTCGIMYAVKSGVVPRHPVQETPHVDSLPPFRISNGCVWRRSTWAFERFGLFSGQVFARPLRNQPAHCPARTIQLRRRNPDARRNPGVIVRPRAACRTDVFSPRNFRKFNSDAGAACNVVCDDPDFIEPRVKWRTMVTAIFT